MSEPELYLILHKVRGEPAFDIAHQIEIEGEECWIIGTSGHRAYPSWYISLNELMPITFIDDDTCEYHYTVGQALIHGKLKVPDDWPDHYSVNKSQPEEKLEARSLLASLGLPTTTHNAMTGKLVRRV
jgi:hypothetical protein